MRMKGFRWYQLALFGLAFLSLLTATVYGIAVYGRVPAEIPTHFDFVGRADAYGGKSSLILFLTMGWFLYAVMIAVSLFPETWNTGVAVTEANRERVYSVIRTMLSVLTFAIALFFSCTVFCSAQGKPLPVFALPVFLLLIFGSLIVSLVRLVRSR